MAKLAIKRASTSKLARIFIQDSSQTDGRGLTGLVFNTASLVAYYIKEGQATATAITLATMTVGTWASGGFKEVDATNMPGVYEIGIPDAALSTGNSTLIMLKGAANMVPTLLEIELDAFDPQDAAGLGLSRIDVALSTLGTAANLATVAGYIDTEVAAIKAKTDNLPASPAAVGSAMTLDLTQALSLTPTANTVGDGLLAALAQGAGTWTLVGTTLTLKSAAGTTLYSFTLDSATDPTSRTRI